MRNFQAAIAVVFLLYLVLSMIGWFVISISMAEQWVKTFGAQLRAQKLKLFKRSKIPEGGFRIIAREDVPRRLSRSRKEKDLKNSPQARAMFLTRDYYNNLEPDAQYEHLDAELRRRENWFFNFVLPAIVSHKFNLTRLQLINV